MAASSDAVSIVPPGQLVYGIQLPIQAQTTILAQPWEASAGTAELRGIAEACDRSGFFYIAACDHICVPRERATAMSTTWYDTVATLGYLAAATKRVRLLSHVYVLPYRHPLLTAKAFSTLDRLSDGRVILGVGAGHLEGEFASLGVDFTRRGKLLDEAIDLVRAAFLDEYPEHSGAEWSVREVGLGPRPVQRPRPPIWVGGSSPAALRRAARRGDGWLPQGTPRGEMPAQIELLRRERDRAHGAAPFDIGGSSGWLYVGEPSWDVGAGTVSGVPARIAASIRELSAMGVNHVQVRFRARSAAELIEQIERFGADVGPLLGGTEGRG